jgi:hypothetical protein
MVLLASVASSLLMAVLYQPDVDPSRVYYGTDTRAAGLLAGAALAFVWVPGRVARAVSPWLLNAAGLAALGALALVGLRLGHADPLLYRGGFLMVDLATVALLVVIVEPRARLVSGLLGLEPLRWLGTRSYGIYLWHWPVFALTRPGLDVPVDGLTLLALRLVATGVLAELSYRLIESPVRSGAFGRTLRAARDGRRRAVRLGWAGAAAALLVGTGLLGTSVAMARPPEVPEYLATASIDTWQAEETEPIPDVPAPEPTPEAPVPQPSPEVAAAPDPTPEPPRASQPQVSGDDPVNVRAGPGTNYAVVTVLGPGEPIALLGRSTDSTWANVMTPDETQGWVRADLLSIPPATDLPVVAAPPTPVPPAPAPASARQTSRRVTAIGDSIMLGAAATLQDTIGGIEIDAAVSRQAQAGIARLQTRAAGGSLGDVVVVHLGNNGTFTERQFESLMDILADVPRVVIVNLAVPRAWESPNNNVLASGVRRHPNAVLVDWHSASAGRSDLFWGDGMHLRPTGATIYATLLATAIGQ